jgi:hypothetical protein
MTSILLDTHLEPLLKILHRILQHVFWHSWDFMMNGKFQLLDHSWSVRVHSCLEVSPQKKSQTDRSGERGGQETSPKREIPIRKRLNSGICLTVVILRRVAQWVRLALFKGPNKVGVSSSPEDGNRSSFRNVFSVFLNTWRLTRSKNPVILNVIHHCRNRLVSISSPLTYL